EAVQDFRLSSNRQVTRELASLPYRFAFISHKETSYLLVPSVSSERRTYIPMGFLPADTIASNLCLIIPDAQIYHFGVLTSAMHMAWVHQVCGRLKSDYRYSAKLVYNNFPWPENLTAKQRGEVEKKAQAVLNVRQKHFDGGATLADLYDPLYTPADLLKAHQELDRAVDLCYRPQPFVTETARVEFLFNLYAQYTESLLNQEKTQRKPRVRA
ncbi:MAG: type IIL restriction-modification enzyme MmeI, partial [Kiritimatiellales bacterium]